MAVEDLVQTMISTYRYLAPHQQIAMHHQIAEMGLQTFSLAHPAMARSKAALTEPETNAHQVFLPRDGDQLREKRHSSN